MGMIKEAEKQFVSAIKNQSMVALHLELAKVAIRQDQPLRAIDIYSNALLKHCYDPSLQVGIARIYEMLNDAWKSFVLYKTVLTFDNNSIESIASIASYHFYTD